MRKLLLFLAVFSLLSSCSKHDEYEPMPASAISNALYMSIVDEKGKDVNFYQLLSEDNISITDKRTSQKEKLEIVDSEGHKMIRVYVDLPDAKTVVFNSDKTEGNGNSNITLDLDGQKIPITVNFVYSSIIPNSVYGGNSIKIKDIEYAESKIKPTENLNNSYIRVINKGDSSIVIEPF